MYTTTLLPVEDDLAMPPKGPRLTKNETDRLRLWIEQGAAWPADEVLKQVEKIDFVSQVQPILEFNCVSCHMEGNADGDYRMDTRELAFKGGEQGVAVVPFKSSESPLYTLTTLPEDHPDIMPPKDGPLPPEEIEILKNWIDQGAVWPDGVTLVARKKEQAAQDDTQLVLDIYENAFRFEKMGWAASISVAMFLVVALLTIIQTRVLRSRWEY